MPNTVSSPTNKTPKKGVSGLFYALYRCPIEGNIAPLSNYVESEVVVLKCIWKDIWENARGIFLLILLVVLFLCYESYKIGNRNGWNDSQNEKSDFFQQQLEHKPKAEREKLYLDWMTSYDGDFVNLQSCGCAAFKNEDYEWCVKIYEELYGNKGVWDDNVCQFYPYYAGALILLNKPNEAESKIALAIQSVDDDIKNKKGSLNDTKSLGGFLTRISEVRAKLPNDKKHYMDSFRDQIKSRINDLGK